MKISLQEKMNAVVKTLPSSGYKMGDKFTLTVGELTATHDTREYYSGRGAKYNSSIRHGRVSVMMTEKELNKAYRPVAARIIELKKRAIREKKYLKLCKSPAFIAEKAAIAVMIIGSTNRDNAPKDYDWTGREDFANDTHLSHYRGCGVYRTGWKDGAMTCTLYGGFHDSCPHGIDPAAWQTAVIAEMKKHSDHIVKMDGSGTQFFFRDIEDADLVTNATEIYYVPSSKGGMHLNIQPAFAEIEGPKLLANG